MPQRVRAGLDAGLFGDLILVEARLKWFRGDQYYEGWHGTWKMDGGGSLMNQTVHLIDQLQWYGGDIEQVVGRMKVCTHKIETEDLGLALVDFANGAKGVIVGTTTFPESRTYDMEIHGSKFGAAWGSVNKEYCRSLPEGTDLPARPGRCAQEHFRRRCSGPADGPEGAGGRQGRAQERRTDPGGLQVGPVRQAGEAAAEDVQAAGGGAEVGGGSTHIPRTVSLSLVKGFAALHLDREGANCEVETSAGVSVADAVVAAVRPVGTE